MQQAKIYPQPEAGPKRQKYVGTVTSWEPRVRFGRHLPVPWEKPFTCWASSKEEADTLLHRKAAAEGYALGGVKDIQPMES